MTPDYETHARLHFNMLEAIREELMHLNPSHQHAITFMLDKIAKLLSGDPNNEKLWSDIAGYAELGSTKCEDPRQMLMELPEPDFAGSRVHRHMPTASRTS